MFKYRGPNGEVIKELRHPDEVFNPDSLNTLAYIPVTDLHPEEGNVTPENADRLQVGQTGKPDNEDPFIGIDVVITRDRAIKSVQMGREELSCGYSCTLDWSAGEWNGEPYDAIQKNIRYNHLALVDRGRAGPQVRLKLDAGDAEEVTDADAQESSKEEEKMKVKIGDKEFEVSEEAGKAINDALKQHDEVVGKLKSDLSAMEEQKAAEAKKADAAQAKLDTAELKLQERADAAPSEEIIKQRVDARIAVLKVAEKVELPKETKLDSMSDLEVKKAVLAAYRPELKLDGKSEEYVSVAFDMASEDIAKAAEGLANLGSKLNQGARADQGEPSAADARAKFTKDSEEAWKAPLSV